jgi:hypothetical protein
MTALQPQSPEHRKSLPRKRLAAAVDQSIILLIVSLCQVVHLMRVAQSYKLPLHDTVHNTFHA